jgi:16S rRNA (uracil1498-N3)-methyltransferase
VRAHYYPELLKQDDYILEGDALHHLVHVVRLEEKEELLLLDGKGNGARTVVEALSKKQLRLKFLEWKNQKRAFELDLLLAIPKKEALELSLKEATELGFRRVYLVRGEYSQIKIPEADRMKSVLVSALEQANAFYLPDIQESTWEDVPWNDFLSIVLMDSQTKSNKNSGNKSSTAARLLIVGPEGGFSPGELAMLHDKPQVEGLFLPTPILRTPTAVAAGAGVMLQRLMD